MRNDGKAADGLSIAVGFELDIDIVDRHIQIVYVEEQGLSYGEHDIKAVLVEVVFDIGSADAVGEVDGLVFPAFKGAEIEDKDLGKECKQEEGDQGNGDAPGFGGEQHMQAAQKEKCGAGKAGGQRDEQGGACEMQRCEEIGGTEHNGEDREKKNEGNRPPEVRTQKKAEREILFPQKRRRKLSKCGEEDRKEQKNSRHGRPPMQILVLAGKRRSKSRQGKTQQKWGACGECMRGCQEGCAAQRHRAKRGDYDRDRSAAIMTETRIERRSVNSIAQQKASREEYFACLSWQRGGRGNCFCKFLFIIP